MSLRWPTIEMKLGALLLLLLAVFAYVGWTVHQSRADLVLQAQKIQTAAQRGAFLGQLLAAANDPALAASAAVTDSGLRLRQQMAALERASVALEQLRSLYQYDGAIHASLSKSVTAVADDIASLRRTGARSSSMAASQSELTRIATDLLNAENGQIRASNTGLSDAIGLASQTFLLAFASILICGLLAVWAVARQLRAWRSRASHPSAEVFLRPGEVIMDRQSFVAGVSGSIPASLNRSRTVGIVAIGVNDLASLRQSEGQEAVDSLLGQLTGRLRSAFRRSDLVTRLDGDVIVAMLHDIRSRSDIAECSKRIHRAVDGLIVPGIEGQRLSVQVGSAMYPIDGYSGEDLIAAAYGDMSHPSALAAPSDEPAVDRRPSPVPA